jgi:hypothetical protein
MAAGTDHQILAAMTGSPMRSQAPIILVSIPLALRSANHSGTRFMTGIIPSHLRPGLWAFDRASKRSRQSVLIA